MSRQTKYLFLWCIVALFALVGTVSAQDGTLPEDVDEYVESAKYPNCAVPITFLNGQGFSVSGATGGLTADPANVPTSADPLTLLAQPALPIPDVLENTAILVIDSFGTAPRSGMGSYLVQDVVGTLPTDDDDVELSNAYNSQVLPHGVMVFNHISALIQGAVGSGVAPVPLGTVLPPDPAADNTGYSWEVPSSTLGTAKVAVVMVHALDYGPNPANTDIISDKIEAAINALKGEYTRFILNMSFAILECDTAREYAPQRTSKTFQDYADSIGATSDVLFKELITPVDDIVQRDAMHQTMIDCGLPADDEGAAKRQPNAQGDDDLDMKSLCMLPDVSAIFIGAAGNASKTFPFYPAAFPGVTSVSGEDDAGIAFYSNTGAATAVYGGWYKLNGFMQSDPTQVVPVGPTAIYYRGTSFSAPLESVCQALNLTGEPACQPL